ncbi:Uncharacterised protein [Paraprevotella clara]|uniref:Uncharacterized protein n=1 Tax=Paraprevotella clara TaxID=454154 RepID=A0A6N3EFZ1_9BACT
MFFVWNHSVDAFFFVCLQYEKGTWQMVDGYSQILGYGCTFIFYYYGYG